MKFFAQFFNIGLGIPVLEIHSRMSQASRNRASGTFREARKGILFTSDVSARGRSVDVPLCRDSGLGSLSPSSLRGRLSRRLTGSAGMSI